MDPCKSSERIWHIAAGSAGLDYERTHCRLCGMLYAPLSERGWCEGCDDGVMNAKPHVQPGAIILLLCARIGRLEYRLAEMEREIKNAKAKKA